MRQRSATILFALVLLLGSAACGKPGAAAGDGSSAANADAKSANKTGAKGDTSAGAAGAASAAEPKVTLPVVAEEARDGDLVLTVNTTGQVRSDAESKLKAEVGGTVQKVNIRPGDRVKAGQPLVVLDSRPFDLAVRSAEVALQEADLRAKDNWVPDSIVSGKAPTPERRANAELRNGVTRARVALEQAKLDRDKSITIAPFDGVVDKVSVAQGERVSAGQDITTIVDVDHLRIEAAVLAEEPGPLTQRRRRVVSTSTGTMDNAHQR